MPPISHFDARRSTSRFGSFVRFGCGINPWGMLALYAPNLQFAWAMEASDGGPSATSIVARSRPEYRIPPGSSITWFSGLLISASGLLLIGITSLQWAELQPPGSTLGPPSYVQALTLRITEGIYTCIFGVVLSVGGFILSKRDAPEEDAGRWLLSQRWRSLLPYVAVALILIASLISALPAPQRTVEFGRPIFISGASQGTVPTRTTSSRVLSRPLRARLSTLDSQSPGRITGPAR